MVRDIVIEIAYENVLDFSADVLFLKHAQSSYGVDKQIVERLHESGVALRHLLPSPSQRLIVDTRRFLFTPSTVFIGVEPLCELWYPQMASLGENAIATVATQLPQVRHIAMTTHGAGFGLDCQESFEHLLEGLIAGIQDCAQPLRLERISIIEQQLDTALELVEVLEDVVRRGILLMTNHGLTRLRVAS